MKATTKVVAALAACIATVLAGPGNATAATCYSSTPANGAWADPAWDVESYEGTRFAPDITQMRSSLDGSCALAFDFSIDSETASSDFYSYWLDSDNTTATGSQSGFTGADYSIGKTASSAPALMRVSSSGSTEFIKELPAVGTYGALVHLNDLGVSPGTGMAVYGGTLWSSPSGTNYTDFVPEPGNAALQFPFTFSATAPQPVAPPPAQPAPTAPPAATTPRPVTTQSAPSCRVPRLKGLTLAQARRRLKAANCATGKVFRRPSSSFYVGKVIRSSPGAGTTLANGAKVNVRVGKRKPRRRARSSSAGVTGLEHLMTQIAAAHHRR